MISEIYKNKETKKRTEIITVFCYWKDLTITIIIASISLAS